MQQHSSPQPRNAGAAAESQSGDQCNATVIHWQDLNAELAIFRVAPDSGCVPDFQAGQFATIGLPRCAPPVDPSDNFPPEDPRWKKLIRRAYSIASSPLEKKYLEFYVVEVKDGKLTPRIWRHKLGGRIWLEDNIRGDFTLHGVPDGKDLIFISTGTGLAPYISMLKTYRSTGRWRKCVIIHGVRLAEDLGYRQELERISAVDPSVVYIPTVTREPEGSSYTGPRGRIPAILENGTYEKLVGSSIDPATCHLFLCGNPDMINQVEHMMKMRGFTVHNKKHNGNLHFERYW